jgi:hypothetical protein
MLFSRIQIALITPSCLNACSEVRLGPDDRWLMAHALRLWLLALWWCGVWPRDGDGASRHGVWCVVYFQLHCHINVGHRDNQARTYIGKANKVRKTRGEPAPPPPSPPPSLPLSQRGNSPIFCMSYIVYSLCYMFMCKPPARSLEVERNSVGRCWHLVFGGPRCGGLKKRRRRRETTPREPPLVNRLSKQQEATQIRQRHRRRRCL